ncbi:hypothetical protein BH11PSE9_BH11PSE9_12100 [soil metagenome]
MLEASASAKGYTPRDEMYLWWLADPASPRLVGDLSLVDRGRGVALRYASDWLDDGMPLSEDLPLEPRAFLPLVRDTAVGAVDDARPDRWGERVIRALDKPPRLSLLEYLYFAGDNRFGALGVSLSRDAYAPSAVAALWPTVVPGRMVLSRARAITPATTATMLMAVWMAPRAVSPNMLLSSCCFGKASKLWSGRRTEDQAEPVPM